MNAHKAPPPELASSSRRTFVSGIAATAVAVAASTNVLAADSSTGGGVKPAAAAPSNNPGKSPLTKLSNGVEMPIFGVGTFALPTIQTADVVGFALKNGYRLIDTAANYGNEKAVEEGITVYADAGRAAETAVASQIAYPAAPHESLKGSGDFFTGDVQVDRLFPANATAQYSGAYVTFQPGARSAWHSHPAGQHLIVTNGVALTGTRDGQVIRVGAGDTVWCPPALEHWHGATPDAPMTHLVITGVLDGKNVAWKEHVTDAQYRGQP